jgi:hypothetical protein
MKKVLIADLIKASKMPEPGDPEDAGIENIIDLSPIGVATYKHNPEHDVYVVTLTLDKGGEVREYVLTPEGLKDLIDLGTKYFYQEMESNTFDMQKAMPEDDGSGCNPDNPAGCMEYNDSIGEFADHPGSYYDITAEFDYNNDNYVLTIVYHKGGEQERIVDGATAEDFINNGLNERKRNPPMPWPFGSLDHLHWPNQA